ncbi:alpha-L-rhamnosidase [Sphingomonas sp.]|uniref:MGH1-like glycoside hydrolase domain-containing protein n=1 Tax=Sphingomonas sp. TaxID=28214 RepID=UPI000DB31D34|nr:alpha-L-rhamnosidase [Sphingomonas sp.]PZU08155.1 MAG: alpha-L-rhamnosidase [Sphingomonas sp.]
MKRRDFLAGAVMLAGLPRSASALSPIEGAPRFATGNAGWQAAYDKALAVLAANVQTMPYVSRPVLIEGSNYQGIWQECGPHEALVYRDFRPDVARDSHLTFFELQRADGQLPANNKLAETGFGQIQMVVPIAATAWELARATGDEELLAAAYAACSAWDGWLMRYRNTRGTGLIEGFCTYDTGHDNSPRWAGMPNQCPNKDAKRHHPIASLPRLCPDLSATVHGGRRALAEMATALGKTGEADIWAEQAERIRSLILAKLYVAEDAAFYDLDAEGRFVRVRSDILSRVCGEHVPDQKLFDDLWARQIHNPAAFWAPFPLPSIALDDPAFVRPIPPNSWGGATQALTALRAGRWMEHYGRPAEFAWMMDRWCEALQADTSFRQQIDPQDGRYSAGDNPGYSPSALVMIDYTWRLLGVRNLGDELEWNIRPAHVAASGARFDLPLGTGRSASIAYSGRGADLMISGRPIARIEGGSARLLTDMQGRIRALAGIDGNRQRVTIRSLPNGQKRSHMLAANQRVDLR